MTIKSFKEFITENELVDHPISKMREYNKDEKPWEWREFTNYHQSQFPKAFKDEKHFWHEYDKAPLRHLSKDEFHNLDYSTASSYVGKTVDHVKRAMSHRRDIDRIVGQVKDKMPPPIVLKHRGGVKIMGGNTRMSVGAAMKLNIPVKVIDISDRH